MNIIIAGVGGQGTLLASRVLGQYATMKGFDCKLSEVHGMAQRGGSVVTYVKIADRVYSPIVGDGDADLLIAFEQLEALRWAHAVRPGGDIVMNTQEIMPLPVITFKACSMVLTKMRTSFTISLRLGFGRAESTRSTKASVCCTV